MQTCMFFMSDVVTVQAAIIFSLFGSEAFLAHTTFVVYIGKDKFGFIN